MLCKSSTGDDLLEMPYRSIDRVYRLRYYFFDLIFRKYDINKSTQMHSIWHETFKIASVSGAPPQTPLGELTTLPQTPSREGLRAFGNRIFAPLPRPLPRRARS